jgi:RimJ/RimL family protein N-acetyltransferase
MLCLELVFETMGAHKVILTCDDANAKSHRVAERCGFVREGVLREQKKRRDGSFAGTVFYGLLRDEYEALRP